MKRLPDFTPITWLLPNIEPTSQFIYPGILPMPFEAYCRIYHTKWEDPFWGNDPNEAPHVTFDQRLLRAHRILWKTLAARGGIPYTVDLHESDLCEMEQPRQRFLSSGEGYLDPTTLDPLVELLQPYTGGELCFFFYVFLATTNWTEPTDQLYQGQLTDVLAIRHKQYPSLRLTPTYWWPESQRWCVWSDYDNESSFLCGPTALIESVIAHPDIEALWYEPRAHDLRAHRETRDAHHVIAADTCDVAKIHPNVSVVSPGQALTRSAGCR